MRYRRSKSHIRCMRFFALHFGLDAIPSLRTKQKNKKNEKEGLTRIIRTINLLSVNCSRRGSAEFSYGSLFNAEVASKRLFLFKEERHVGAHATDWRTNRYRQEHSNHRGRGSGKQGSNWDHRAPGRARGPAGGEPTATSVARKRLPRMESQPFSES